MKQYQIEIIKENGEMVGIGETNDFSNDGIREGVGFFTGNRCVDIQYVSGNNYSIIFDDGEVWRAEIY